MGDQPESFRLFCSAPRRGAIGANTSAASTETIEDEDEKGRQTQPLAPPRGEHSRIVSGKEGKKALAGVLFLWQSSDSR